jgi:hypothetical protein
VHTDSSSGASPSDVSVSSVRTSCVCGRLASTYSHPSVPDASAQHSQAQWAALLSWRQLKRLRATSTL